MSILYVYYCLHNFGMEIFPFGSVHQYIRILNCSFILNFSTKILQNYRVYDMRVDFFYFIQLNSFSLFFSSKISTCLSLCLHYISRFSVMYIVQYRTLEAILQFCNGNLENMYTYVFKRIENSMLQFFIFIFIFHFFWFSHYNLVFIQHE